MSSADRLRIAGRVRQARLECGRTQRQLAERLGVSVRSVQNYESGAVVPFRHLGHIETIARKRRGWILEGSEPTGTELETAVASLSREIDERHRLMIEQLRELTAQVARMREWREAAVRRRGPES